MPRSSGFAIAVLAALCLTAACQRRTEVSPDRPTMFAFHFDFDPDLDKFVPERYPDLEIAFLEASMSLVREYRERLPAPATERSIQYRMTYPASEFPAGYPDGVWFVEPRDETVPDARLLRRPIGKEVRGGESDKTIRTTLHFARQRSERATHVVGTLSTVLERAVKTDAGVQYQFVSIELTGVLDATTKKWEFEPASITPSVLLNARIPIVYGRRISGDAVLTDEQVREIVTALPERWSEGLARWFIHARAVWKNDFAATVYFKWDFESPRIRRGICMPVVSRAARSSVGEILKALGGTGGTDYPTARYCQVSAKGTEFAGDDAPPALTNLPFRDPEGFTDAEIVAIVDFVRANPRIAVADVGKGASKPAAGALTIERADSRLPILEITRDGGIIEVKTGSLEGPLSGAGEILRIRATDGGGYELVEFAFWVS
ncbi:MAG: hypothetical protein AMXMBFR47_06690 [Planctomycetota bacterium]